VRWFLLLFLEFFVVNGYDVFVFAAELPRYQSSILHCRALVVSLFNIKNKSLSSEHAVPEAFVFLVTYFLQAIAKLRLGFTYC